MKTNRKTLGMVIGLALASIGANKIYTKIVTPRQMQPDVEVLDKDHIRRRSYTPHGSLFRTAVEWHDMTVEDYARTPRGDFRLAKKVSVVNHYPLFIGDRTVEERAETFDPLANR